jgi:hypothetical protein
LPIAASSPVCGHRAKRRPRPRTEPGHRHLFEAAALAEKSNFSPGSLADAEGLNFPGGWVCPASGWRGTGPWRTRRLVGAVELLLSVAERIDGEIADEAILADLYELRERAYAAMLRPSEH